MFASPQSIRRGRWFRRAAVILGVAGTATVVAAGSASASTGPTLFTFGASTISPWFTVTGNGFTPNGSVAIAVYDLSQPGYPLVTSATATAAGSHWVCGSYGGQGYCWRSAGGELSWQGGGPVPMCGDTLEVWAFDYGTARASQPLDAPFICVH